MIELSILLLARPSNRRLSSLTPAADFRVQPSITLTMAILYCIRDWDRLFENNRSRTIEDLRWVPIPNKHDGETFSAIMDHPDGAIIFTGWILLVQIASKCKPRGTLIKGNGEPHNVTSMAAKCRANVSWLTLAINWLISNSDWLYTKEVTSERHPTDAQVPDERQVGVIEGRKEGMEGKEAHAHSNSDFSEKPSWEEFWEYSKMHGCPIEAICKDKFLAAEQDNWKGKSNWKAYVTRVRTWWEADGRPQTPRNSHAAPKGRRIAI